MDNFLQRKKDILKKIDKSSKKSWDKKIKKLCDRINKLDNYYTTSSCSGRVVVMLDKKQKKPGLFLNIYHDLIKLRKFKNDIDKLGVIELVKFKQEPPILHVHCKTLKDAQKLLRKSQLAGWKKSGIISSGKRFILEMNGTDRLEFLLMNRGMILVTNAYLELIIKRCNENLKSGWQKIKKLEKSL
jgi:tRNA wybutosine-synthesizing protein 3